MQNTCLICVAIFIMAFLLLQCNQSDDDDDQTNAESDDDSPDPGENVGKEIGGFYFGLNEEDEYSAEVFHNGVFVKRILGGYIGYFGISSDDSPDGRIYVAATKGDEIVVYYREYGGAEWKQVFLSFYGYYPVIKTDEHGALHFLFISAWDGTLTYATNRSGQWESSSTHIKETEHAYDIAVDRFRNAHIFSWSNELQSYIYGNNTAGFWRLELIPTRVNDDYFKPHAKIVIDDYDTVNLAYLDELFGYYGSNEYGFWNTYPIVEFPTLIDLIVDHFGNKHILAQRHRFFIDWVFDYHYYWPFINSDDRLVYITDNGSRWNLEYIPSGALQKDEDTRAQSVLDSNGNMHIALRRCYYDSCKMQYLNNAGGNWNFDFVLQDDGHNWHSIVAAKDDQVSVIYGPYENENDEKHNYLMEQLVGSDIVPLHEIDSTHITWPKYKMLLLKNQEDETIVFCYLDDEYKIFNPDLDEWEHGGLDYGQYLIDKYYDSEYVQIDQNGYIHIALVHVGQSLRYYENTSGQFVEHIVDGFEPGIVDMVFTLDENDHAHFAYLHRNQGLKYATNKNGAWVVENPDGPFDEIDFTIDLDLDSALNPFIVYLDNNVNLSIISKASGSWVKENIRALSDWDVHCSISLDGNDHPHIAYIMQGSARALVYVVKQNNTWMTEVVDTNVYNENLLLDQQGKVYFVYRKSDEINYKYKQGNTWVGGTILPIGEEYLRAFMDSTGMIHLTFANMLAYYYARFDKEIFEN